MKAKSAKAKGTRLEAQVVKDLQQAGLQARRQPGSGIYDAFPHDVEMKLRGERYIVECKSRKNSFQTLDNWLGAADLLVVKNDRSEPRVYLTWSAFTRMLGDAEQQPRWAPNQEASSMWKVGDDAND